MPFGKRSTPPGRSSPAGPLYGQAAGLGQVATPLPTWLSAEQRLLALRDIMLQLLGQAALVAEAVRSDGTLELTGLDTALRPQTTPLDIRGIDEPFTFDEGGGLAHAVFGYIVPAAPARVDSSAQVHLEQLAARVLELNHFCQRAQWDGALRVALQSPKLPALIDRILVGCAFFAAFFDNLLLTRSVLAAATQDIPPAVDFDRLQENAARRHLMASDHMFSAPSLNELMPFAACPYVAVETTFRPHAGERFVNGIYFPEGLAPQPTPPLMLLDVTGAA